MASISRSLSRKVKAEIYLDLSQTVTLLRNTATPSNSANFD
jgi:hypothetical protein